MGLHRHYKEYQQYLIFGRNDGVERTGEFINDFSCRLVVIVLRILFLTVG